MRLPFFQNYSKVEHSDFEEEEERRVGSQVNMQDSQQIKRSLTIIQVEVVLLMLISLVLGFFMRSISSALVPSNNKDLLLAPSGNIQQIWQYEKLYSRAPDDESEAAWRNIFPKGRGFVHHETFAPNISGIAVFHELHCLHGIRMAYYHALTANATSEVIPAASHEQGAGHEHNSDAHLDALNAHNDPHHIRHCFDYLRQALMCAADSNLEDIDWKRGGTTGWGFKRQCRDYSAVVDWAERYRLHSQTDIS